MCYLGFDELSGLPEVLGTELAGGTIHIDELTVRSDFALDGTITQRSAFVALQLRPLASGAQQKRP